MGIRETLNRFPNLSTALAAVGVVIIGIVIWFQIRQNTPTLPRAYYTVDDGATYFEDEPDKLTPFDYRGKPAVGAVIFQGKDGKPFVGYMTRIDPAKHEAVKRFRGLTNSNTPPGPKELREVAGSGQIKRPGDKNWITDNGPGSLEMKAVKLPDGTPATRVE